MQTSAARTSRGRTRAQAFTLLEMLVVLVLLSLIAGIGIPAVQAVLQGQTQREATRLAALIRTLRNESVLTRTDFRLVFSLKERAYWVEERKDGRFRLREEPSLLRKHAFPAAFTLTDLSILGGTSPAGDRPVPLTVDASGFMDPFLLHFTVNGDPYTLKVSGFRADMDLQPGYVRE
jgi:prepilin-type N-terminal cleavage/methylation domain-containing protein